MTRKPRFSTNSRGRTNQAHVQKLARAIFFSGTVGVAQGGACGASNILRAIEQIAPEAPRDVVAKAITLAMQEAEDLLARSEEECREMRELLGSLAQVQPSRPVLRVIQGGQPG